MHRSRNDNDNDSNNENNFIAMWYMWCTFKWYDINKLNSAISLGNMKGKVHGKGDKKQ